MEKITVLLPGGIMRLSDDLFGFKSKSPKEDMTVELCEKRNLFLKEAEMPKVSRTITSSSGHLTPQCPLAPVPRFCLRPLLRS